MINPLENIAAHFNEHSQLIAAVSALCSESIKSAGAQTVHLLENDGTLFWCGNGGSAANSQYMASELIGRFKKDLIALRSIALTTDTSALKCFANDFSYEDTFLRQLWVLARDGDELVAISTSGNIENILRALKAVRELGVKTIVLLRKDGVQVKVLANLAIDIPGDSTARIEEAHVVIGHIPCDLIERELGIV
ncbi:SIS domain-containing protein [Alphaproteobacteria bacterium LSUCC0744]